MTSEVSLNQRVADILKGGDVNKIMALRSELKDVKLSIEQQLADDKEERRALVIAAINDGREPGESALLETDWDWRSRASTLRRRIDGYLRRIKDQLGPRRNAAVVVAGAGRSAAAVAEACNMFLSRGSWINNVIVVGNDVVIIGTAPTQG